MSKFFGELLDTIRQYFRDFVGNGYQDIWVPLVAIASAILITIVLTKRFSPRHPKSREVQILKMTVLAFSVVQMILLGVFCYLWADTDYYQNKPNQLVHLLAVLLPSIWSLAVITRFSQLFERRKVRGLYHPAFTLGEHARFLANARSIFKKTKGWMLLSLAGFVMLLFIFRKPDYLVAVLIDNSSSMDENIEIGKTALSQTFSDFDEHTDIIISWFTEQSPKTSIGSVKSVSRWDRLEGNHAFFEDGRQALQHLESIELTGGTPLYETIHGQFLFAKDQTANSDYSKMVLVLVTDGGESYLGGDPNALSQLLCTDPEFDDFWDEVGVMNLSGDLTNAFYDLVLNECQYYVEEDATGLSSYQTGVDEMVRSFKHDWYFPIWLAIIIAIWLIISFLIPSKAY